MKRSKPIHCSGATARTPMPPDTSAEFQASQQREIAHLQFSMKAIERLVNKQAKIIGAQSKSIKELLAESESQRTAVKFLQNAAKLTAGQAAA